MAEHSRHQQKIIRNYYQNRESISLQRAQELVTELFLSQGKKRQQYWRTLQSHLQRLGVKDDVIKHLVEQDDPKLVAQVLQKMSG